MSGTGGIDYAGDVGARAAWDELARNPEATLVDVRTRAEWTYVGVPVLTEIGKQTAASRVGRVPDRDSWCRISTGG